MATFELVLAEPVCEFAPNWNALPLAPKLKLCPGLVGAELPNSRFSGCGVLPNEKAGVAGPDVWFALKLNDWPLVESRDDPNS